MTKSHLIEALRKETGLSRTKADLPPEVLPTFKSVSGGIIDSLPKFWILEVIGFLV
jgi:hypothetical protein